MIGEGASDSLTKMADVDIAKTPKNKAKYGGNKGLSNGLFMGSTSCHNRSHESYCTCLAENSQSLYDARSRIEWPGERQF
ncbi:hypothetical protein BBO01nite_12950 [Brevibacillus borstelensis]|jgi:hypothetical protein|nr:hypothetical protein BBO01nite_12950 [Brevibacillus borstelensis]